MKRNYLLIAATALLGFSSLFSSCKKDDEVSLSEAMVGNWGISKFAIDDGDGMLSESEISSAYSIGFDVTTLTFNSDKSGSVSSISQYYYIPQLFGNGTFNWDAEQKTQTLRVYNSYGQSIVAKLSFQDLSHFAVLEPNSALTYGQSVWIFCDRK